MRRPPLNPSVLVCDRPHRVVHAIHPRESDGPFTEPIFIAKCYERFCHGRGGWQAVEDGKVTCKTCLRRHRDETN